MNSLDKKADKNISNSIDKFDKEKPRIHWQKTFEKAEIPDKSLEKNFVKAHALGFSSQINRDFFEHYYRMLLGNFAKITLKEKNSNFNEEIKEKAEEILYIPADIKGFFLEKIKEDINFYDKIIEIYENSQITHKTHEKNTGKTLEKNTGKKEGINKKNQINIRNFKKKQVFLHYSKDFEGKMLEEDQFLKVFIKKSEKFGLEIHAKEDFSLFKDIIFKRKTLLESIENGEFVKKKLDKKRIFSKKMKEILMNFMQRNGVFNEENEEISLEKTAILKKNQKKSEKNLNNQYMGNSTDFSKEKLEFSEENRELLGIIEEICDEKQRGFSNKMKEKIVGFIKKYEFFNDKNGENYVRNSIEKPDFLKEKLEFFEENLKFLQRIEEIREEKQRGNSIEKADFSKEKLEFSKENRELLRRIGEIREEKHWRNS